MHIYWLQYNGKPHQMQAVFDYKIFTKNL